VGTLIYSHSDPDGITSARIVALSKWGGEARVLFTPRLSFGVELLPETFPEENLVCLDIGSMPEVLSKLYKLSKSGKRVMLIDHHPMTDPIDCGDNFYVYNDVNHCTASLSYKLFKGWGMFEDTRWPYTWAVIGTYADTANNKPGGQELLSDPLMWKNMPELLVKEDFENYQYNPVKAIERRLNMVRKIGYELGARVIYGAFEEAEKVDDVFFLLKDLPPEQWGTYQNTAMLRKLSDEYTEAVNNAKTRVLCFEEFVLGLTTCKADIAGELARENSRRFRKPCFVVNDGIIPGTYKLSGRAIESNVDLNRVMHYASISSGGRIIGGGHPQACSGVFPVISTTMLVRALTEGIRSVKRESL
jgi:single-stranded DNA-specific DHH superfamily exonuclease